jgi:GR25 family glycosyltransferase involved in LPS biosynthesis
MIDIYVIHLADRPDRYEQVIKDFSIYTNINLIFVDAIKHNPGAIGCSLSFKKCVSIAKVKKLPYIIIAEDDCMPMNNFENRLKNILEYLESNNDWSLFLGAVRKSNRIVKKFTFEKETIYAIKRGHCAHLSIFHSSIYDDVLNFDENTLYADTFWHGKYNALLTIPFLAHQHDGFSSIENRYNNQFTEAFNKTEKNLINSLTK